MNKKHLTSAKRHTISVMYRAERSQKEIAVVREKCKSVISREIKRNSNPKTGKYHHLYDQDMATIRKERFRQPKKMTFYLKRTIIFLLQEGYSPEQISDRLKLEGKATVSYETIYKMIRSDKKAGGNLYRYCRHQLKKHKRIVYKSPAITDKISIAQRPAIVNTRGRFGDWEMDAIIDKNHKSAILTLVERSCNYCIIAKLQYGKKAQELAKVVIELLSAHKDLVHMITVDNGTEFTCYKEIEKGLDAKIYFTHPYSACENGTIENTNKLIRQYIPKNAVFSEFDELKLKKIQEKINKRHRKKLEYYNPNEKFEYFKQSYKVAVSG